MDVETAVFDIKHPVLGNTSAGVEPGFGGEIVLDCARGDLNEKADIFWAGVLFGVGIGGICRHGEIRFWLVFGAENDGKSDANMFRPKRQ